MTTLLNSRRPFCSNTVDKTHFDDAQVGEVLFLGLRGPTESAFAGPPPRPFAARGAATHMLSLDIGIRLMARDARSLKASCEAVIPASASSGASGEGAGRDVAAFEVALSGAEGSRLPLSKLGRGRPSAILSAVSLLSRTPFLSQEEGIRLASEGG